MLCDSLASTGECSVLACKVLALHLHNSLPQYQEGWEAGETGLWRGKEGGMRGRVSGGWGGGRGGEGEG